MRMPSSRRTLGATRREHHDNRMGPIASVSQAGPQTTGMDDLRARRSIAHGRLLRPGGAGVRGGWSDALSSATVAPVSRIQTRLAHELPAAAPPLRPFRRRSGRARSTDAHWLSGRAVGRATAGCHWRDCERYLAPAHATAGSPDCSWRPLPLSLEVVIMPLRNEKPCCGAVSEALYRIRTGAWLILATRAGAPKCLLSAVSGVLEQTAGIRRLRHPPVPCGYREPSGGTLPPASLEPASCGTRSPRPDTSTTPSPPRPIPHTHRTATGSTSSAGLRSVRTGRPPSARATTTCSGRWCSGCSTHSRDTYRSPRTTKRSSTARRSRAAASTGSPRPPIPCAERRDPVAEDSGGRDFD
jgi:hypothetical protein